MHRSLAPVLAATLLAALACAGEPAAETLPAGRADPGGQFLVIRDTVVPDVVEASAVAEPVAQATLSTRLMGQVVAVSAREGDAVAAGALLVQLDDRELAARREQVTAGIRSAEAAHEEASLHAARIRALHADSAAARAQLDAAEAALARAEQGVRAARGAAAELEAVAEYAALRAPFAGTVVQRFVDAGGFAAPGAPLVRLEDTRRLRLVAAVPPAAAARVRRGATLAVTVEGAPARGVVEGIVPAAGAALANIQVLVDNPDGRFLSGSAATVVVPGEPRSARLVPGAAIVRSGDLRGVRVRGAGGVSTRWVRLGRERAGGVEVLSGLAAGDTIVVPVPSGPGA